ncbi:MAG: exodeoxyribonuclease VII large subunit [Lachnospiraceae bacterium]|nr:exodeoxyribonuclease VII large subunit [Lachnospiraceae bacterium]
MAASVYSVEQVNSYIKNLFTQDFALRQIYVRGEISNCRYHTSGHIYFTLKDASGVLNAVMFRSQRPNLKIRLQDGMRIVAGGSINVYERDGRYQLYVQTAEADGVGVLYQQYEKLKQELEEMGMFAPEYKQEIPRFSRHIGVVTAPTGAAIRDILNITARRNPCVTLYLYPALVQGEMASASIANGISCLDEMGLDCIIVGRGGGSLEDLWAFNEEETAYAIFHAETPIISAVGHETDYTIADFVADLRAPTPSAAAELAVFDYAAYLNTLQVRKNQLDMAVKMQLERKRAVIDGYKRRLDLQDPVYQLEQKKQQLKSLKEKLVFTMESRMKEYRHRTELYIGKLEALSPLKKLSGGFAYVSDETGQPVQSASALDRGQVIRLQFGDGKVRARITDLEGETDHEGTEKSIH